MLKKKKIISYDDAHAAIMVNAQNKKMAEKFISYLKAQPKGEWRYDEQYIRKSLAERPALDASDFYTRLTNWEYEWAFNKETYPDTPQGGEIEIVKKLYTKWLPVMEQVSK